MSLKHKHILHCRHSQWPVELSLSRLNNVARMWMNTMTTILMSWATLMRLIVGKTLTIRHLWTASGGVATLLCVPISKINFIFELNWNTYNCSIVQKFQFLFGQIFLFANMYEFMNFIVIIIIDLWKFWFTYSIEKYAHQISNWLVVFEVLIHSWRDICLLCRSLKYRPSFYPFDQMHVNFLCSSDICFRHSLD